MSGMSADVGELILAIVFGVSFLIVAYGLWHWRRDQIHWSVLAAALLGSGILISLQNWDEMLFMAVLFSEFAAGAMVVYSLARSRAVNLSPVATAISVAACCLTLPLLLAALVGIPERSLPWVVGTVPALAVLGLPCAYLAKLARGLLRECSSTQSAPPEPASVGERAKVLEMLSEGTISSEDAAELLDALGDQQRPGDALPVSAGLLSAIVGGLAVTAGFVLPWGHVRMGQVAGYQAGYHVGFLGWLILALGLVPPILACIPALDKMLRQGLIRLVIAAPGLVLAGSLFISALVRGGIPGVGLWIVIFGFGIQIAGGLAQTRGASTVPAIASD